MCVVHLTRSVLLSFPMLIDITEMLLKFKTPGMYQHVLVLVPAQDDLSTTPIHFEANSNFEIQEDDPYLQHAIDQLLQKDSSVQKKKAALYILNLKEIRSLSESAVEHVVAQTQSIFAHTLGRVQAGVNGHYQPCHPSILCLLK